jgi:periplasmic divalent cation tolerance protein
MRPVGATGRTSPPRSPAGGCGHPPLRHHKGQHITDTDLRFIYITCADGAEAEKIARALVSERLAACANILPGVRSVYRWKGKIEEAAEVAIIAKTRAGLVDALTERVKALHSYEVPCVVALPITGGNRDFLGWIEEETR